MWWIPLQSATHAAAHACPYERARSALQPCVRALLKAEYHRWGRRNNCTARVEVVRGGWRALQHSAVRCQTRKWGLTHAHFCLSSLSRAAQEEPQHTSATCGSLRGDSTGAKLQDDAAFRRGKCAWRLPHNTRDMTLQTDVRMMRGGPSPSPFPFALPVWICGHRRTYWGSQTSTCRGHKRAAGQMSASGTCLRGYVTTAGSTDVSTQFASCVRSQ